MKKMANEDAKRIRAAEQAADAAERKYRAEKRRYYKKRHTSNQDD
ncbi:hypothetical protein [uncultured Tateyamaria sp.]|nr:hypothetical protein [uncultured Tateyamaria sp.]